jgi:hypothetical protein
MKRRLFLASLPLLCVSGAPSAQDAADPAFLLKQVGPKPSRVPTAVSICT